VGIPQVLPGSRLSDLAEILHDDTYEGPRKMKGVNVGTGSRILPPQVSFFEFRFGGMSPAPIKIYSPNLVCAWKI